MRTKLRPGEKKVLETRAHWLTVLIPFLVLILALAATIAVYAWIEKETDFVKGLRIVCLVFLAVVFLWFLYREIYRRRDIWAVTNLRVIDERGVFNLYTMESPLEKINNLSYYQNIPGRVLNYGRVEIQTAAEDGATIYNMVTGPKKLKDTVARCRDEFSQEAARRESGSRQPSSAPGK
jgi:membrane protein YdbS with pleckstrin-like domain